jgi:hypothetical protein
MQNRGLASRTLVFIYTFLIFAEVAHFEMNISNAASKSKKGKSKVVFDSLDQADSKTILKEVDLDYKRAEKKLNLPMVDLSNFDIDEIASDISADDRVSTSHSGLRNKHTKIQSPKKQLSTSANHNIDNDNGEVDFDTLDFENQMNNEPYSANELSELEQTEVNQILEEKKNVDLDQTTKDDFSNIVLSEEELEILNMKNDKKESKAIQVDPALNNSEKLNNIEDNQVSTDVDATAPTSENLPELKVNSTTDQVKTKKAAPKAQNQGPLGGSAPLY